MTYVNKEGSTTQYPIATALQSNNDGMAKRLKYTKEILTHMLNNNTSKKDKNGITEKDVHDKDINLD